MKQQSLQRLWLLPSSALSEDPLSMICESHFLIRGFFSSERRFSRVFSTRIVHLASLQQHMHLLGNSSSNSSSSLLLSKTKNEVRSLVHACQKLGANPSPHKPLKKLSLNTPSPRFSEQAMVQNPSSTKKITAKSAVDQKVILPQALMSHETPLLHSSTSVENLVSERTKEEWSGVVVSSERRTKQPSLTVAVDIDEVLGSFLLALNTFIAEQYFREHNISEFHVYDFTKVWQCSRAEADFRVHSFFKSKHFDQGILPIPGAYKSLLQMATFCDLCVVTSRQNVIKEETIAWIERHYSGIFKEVHFGNHFALEGEARTKSDICRGVGAQVLIDDNPMYAMDCAKNGIEVLLFDLNNSYPWSKTQEGPQHPLITRVHDWEQVEKILRSKSSDVQI